MADTKLKDSILNSIQNFSNGNLTQNGLSLFNALGYETSKETHLDNCDFQTFEDTFIDDDRNFNYENALTDDWKYIDLLFQLTKEEVLKRTSLFDTKQIDNTIIESYLFITIELAKEQYSRTQFSSITREINKLFPMPVMILFKHGDSLTFSIINRRLHKRDQSKDVLEKVTLIKDINIHSPHRAHIEILYDLAFDVLNKSFNVSNFIELHNAWQKILDTKELNKKFFQELSAWYFWAVKHFEFPDDDEKDRNARNATNVIRLLTRLMFVWFLKEKGLISPELFDKRNVQMILNDSEDDSSTFYKAVLQNLFFATLNTEMGKRKFRAKSSGSRNSNYFVHNVFRYKDYFNNPKEALEKYFANIPFLNGGLFECLDKEIEVNGNLKRIRIDGFSDRSDNPLILPNKFFFHDTEEDIDLNDVYGTQNKKYNFRGILDILNSYKFTIAENTPIEEEIALDPELLGKVFENLLANYNPETQTTARKQTGSFYTPREIVNYMVDESLIAYLNQKLDDNEIAKTKLRHLLSYSDEPHQFNDSEVKTIINAIDTIKILDPACGSGAFPMGILHKLVHILHKLDPMNERWKQRQIDKAAVIDDANARDAAIDSIEEAFENNELDYGRKLFLIENCIYGVDIQPIAAQISKLRFFISLIVDQRASAGNGRTNLGIQLLPNLEFKFVAANTLIRLDEKIKNLFNEEIIQQEKLLEELRVQYFHIESTDKKEEIKNDYMTIRKKINDLLFEQIQEDNDKYRKMKQKEQRNLEVHIEQLEKASTGLQQIKRGIEQIQKKIKEIKTKQEESKSLISSNSITSWNPFAYDSSSWFDPVWMFGIKDGFDIVIGNPPFIDHKKLKEFSKLFKDLFKKTYKGTADIYVYFFEKGIEILKQQGIITFISSNKWIRSDYGSKLRQYFLENNPISLIDMGTNRVFDATVDSSILLLQKEHNKGIFNICFFPKDDSIKDFSNYISKHSVVNSNLTENAWLIANLEYASIKLKIEKKGKSLKNFGVQFYRGILTGYNEAFIIDGETKDRLIAEDPKSAEIIKPILRGRDIKRYKAEFADLWLIATFPALKLKIDDYPAIKEYLEQFLPKIKQTGETFINFKGEKEKTRKRTGNKWFETQDQIAYYEEFEKEKIVWQAIAKKIEFSLDNNRMYSDVTTFIMTGNNLKYILSILNSKFFEFALINIYLEGDTFKSKNKIMQEFPIPQISKKEQKPFEKLVDKIIKKKERGVDTTAEEKQIDLMVYKLYGLTEEEIKIIENNT